MKIRKLHGVFDTVELQWLEHLWNHEKVFEIGVVQLISVNRNARSGSIIDISFQFP